jgi:toxin ParE1/3/4
MTPGYIVRPAADRDLDEIAAYLAGHAGTNVALLFLRELSRTFSLLAEHAEMGWPCRLKHATLEGVRQFRVGGPFNKYVIFYRPQPGRIEILRLRHGARDIDSVLPGEETT